MTSTLLNLVHDGSVASRTDNHCLLEKRPVFPVTLASASFTVPTLCRPVGYKLERLRIKSSCSSLLAPFPPRSHQYS